MVCGLQKGPSGTVLTGLRGHPRPHRNLQRRRPPALCIDCLPTPWHCVTPCARVPALTRHPGPFWREVMCSVTSPQLIAGDSWHFFTPTLLRTAPALALGGGGQVWIAGWTPAREGEREGERGTGSLIIYKFKKKLKSVIKFCLNYISEQEGVAMISKQLLATGRNRCPEKTIRLGL